MRIPINALSNGLHAIQDKTLGNECLFCLGILCLTSVSDSNSWKNGSDMNGAKIGLRHFF